MDISVKANASARRLPHLRHAFMALFAAAIVAACSPRDAVTAPSSYCMNASCEIVLADGGRLGLSLSPWPLKPMRPITALLQVTGSAPERLNLLINGADMDMGFNRATLRRQADGAYSGEFVLPVCVTGRMRWRFDVRLETDDGPPLARFLIDIPE